jgi:hypothetical protein
MNSSFVSCRTRLWKHVKKAAQGLGFAIAFCLACLPLSSQTSQGTIQGGVFDQSGGAVAGATVSVIDVARGVTRALTADGAGQYVAVGLTPGTYTVRAEAKGFRNVEHSGVLLEVGQTVRVDLVVQPGEQTQTITVTGEIPAIDTTDATLGGTVTNRSIMELPLNGRNFERLLDLRPGTVSTPGAGTGSSNSNGRRIQNNTFRVEGIIQIVNTTGSTLMNQFYRGGDSGSLLPIDAIQEFSASYDSKAEAGFRDGSVVNVGIKSGTNSIHGTAYAFGRDASATDASNFFTGQVTPANLEQFGATAGGPIIKDKLFWFANFELVRDVTGNTGTTQAPTSVAGAGVGNSFVDTCRSLGPTGINALSAQLAGLNPNTCVVSPASATVENIFPYFNSASTTFFQPAPSNLPVNNGLAKGDYAINAHHHVSGFLYVSKSFSQTLSANQLLPEYYTGGINNVQQYSGDWTWTPNSILVNDFRLGYIFNRNQTVSGDVNLSQEAPWPNGYDMPTGVTNPLYGGLPTITFSNLSGVVGAGAVGTGLRTSAGGPSGDVDLVDAVSYLRGKHAFKYGFEYVDQIHDADNFTNAQGLLLFSNVTTFLQGSPTNGSISIGNPKIVTRAHLFAGFVQDDWRIKPRLTLNLGLRYEFFTPPVERYNDLGNFNPSVNPLTTPAIEQVGPGEPIPQEYKPGIGYLLPRLGVAWDVKGDGKTVVRAGAGLFTNSEPMEGIVTSTPFGANFPSIGVNNSGTAVNANTFTRESLSTAQLAPNWNLAGNLPAGVTIFPTTTQPVLINGTTYTGVTCTYAGEPGLPPAALFTPVPCQTGATDANYTQAKSGQWNVDVQRVIAANLTVDVAYVGTHGYQEQSIQDLNQPPIGTGWDAGAVSTCLGSSATFYNKCTPDTKAEVAAEPYVGKFPYLSQIDDVTNGSYSNYNALQVTLQGRNYHGLSFLAGYTYSHTLAIVDGQPTLVTNVLPSDSDNLRSDYGNATYDLRHRFLFSPTYLLPGKKSPAQMLEGWSVNAILTLQPGLHFSVADLTKTDWLGDGETLNSGDGNGSYQFWNYVGPNNAFAQNATPPTKLTGAGALSNATCAADAQAPYSGNAQLQSLALAAMANGGCFLSGSGVLTPPAYGTLGDAGHGFFVGPSYKNLDFSVAKLWKLKERYTAQFRVEFFNVLNHTNFGAPGTDPSKSTFGYSTATPDSGNAVLGSGGPRHIQFGLKLTY